MTISSMPIFYLKIAPSLDQTPVRINVSISRAVLEEIDAKARQAGYTRSHPFYFARFLFLSIPRLNPQEGNSSVSRQLCSAKMMVLAGRATRAQQYTCAAHKRI